MPHDKQMSAMLTTSEVAHLLNVHINTVRRWSNQGIIKTYRIGPRSDRRFHRDDIATFLSRAQRKPAESEAASMSR